MIFDAPTAKDVDGNLLSSNVTATGTLSINSDGEITGSTITQAGNGYVVDPGVKIDSKVSNEIRAKDIAPIVILALNHKDDLTGTLDGNRSFNLKAPFDKERFYNNNNLIERIGSTQLQNVGSISINRYNVNSFVHEEVI